MSRSLGEIADLVTKAARGAGLDWGLADELGWAVRWLARCGLPGPEAAAALLAGDRAALRLGIRIADARDPAALGGAGPVDAPLILLPFLGRAAPGGRALRLDAGGRELRVWTGATDLAASLPDRAEVALLGDAPIPAATPPADRIETIAPAALAALEALAARIYAPATEESRARGAGAGMIDND